MKTNLELIFQAAELIESADALLLSAGAGIGVDSGLPDFRGDEGFWKAYPPYKKLGLNFYEMATPEGFNSDPEFAWGFYGHRLNLYRDTAPHIGFYILKKWTELKNGNYFIFTSNVDGQFQKAGFPEKKIEECHGSINHLQCSAGCSDIIFTADGIEVEVDNETMRSVGELPKCKKCGSIARPNILMFGDWGWVSDRTRNQHLRFLDWKKFLHDKKLVIIEIGAGTSVPTVRNLSESFLLETDSVLIRINVREADVPRGNIGISGGASDVLKKIDEVISNQTS